MKSLIYLVFVLFFVNGEPIGFRLDSFKVYRLTPLNKNQSDFLFKLQKDVIELDFWTEVNKIGIPVDIMVPPEIQKTFVQLMKQNNIEVKEMIEDIQKLIDNEKVGKLGKSNEMTWDSYYNLKDIYQWMDSLAEKYPGVVTTIVAGQTYQARDLKGVKISFKPGKRNVFIEGGIHAREWISPATLTYIINELLTNDNQTFREIAESFNWYIFPSTNPDGYEFTHNWYRMWRKTMSRDNGICWGVDPNRNFDYHWGEEGASSNPCSDAYHGPYAFSESETAGISNLMNQIGSETDVYLSFHSYSQVLLLPYGNTPEHLDNYQDMYEIGLKMADALAERYGTKYSVGTVYDIMYQVSGDSSDWAKYTHKIPLTISYELRDTGEHGFLLPAEQIIPNCEEVMDSLIALFTEAENYGYFKLDKTITSFIDM